MLNNENRGMVKSIRNQTRSGENGLQTVSFGEAPKNNEDKQL